MGASRVARDLLRIHAVATTPVQPAGPRRSGCPADASFPCSPRRSAWTSVFSRRAPRSLTLRPGCSPTSFRGLYTEDSSDFVTATAAPVATGWSDSCRVGLTPTEDRRLVTAYGTVTYSLGFRLREHVVAEGYPPGRSPGALGRKGDNRHRVREDCAVLVLLPEERTQQTPTQTPPGCAPGGNPHNQPAPPQ